MPIVLIGEALLRRSTISDGTILRDRVLSGFCVRMNARKRTFRVATSIAGKQFRMNLGYWPMLSVEDARARAMEVLAQCRKGERPQRSTRPVTLPTLREVHSAYCAAKRLKASSKESYASFFRTHFAEWLDRPIGDMAGSDFFDHCQVFAQTKGAAVVELGRGVVGASMKYANAVYDLDLVPPFTKLATMGLMPDRAKPRARVLQEVDLPAWWQAIHKLGEPQRDFLLLTLYTGLRLSEARELRRAQIDLSGGVLSVPMTKNGKPHSLPITPMMRAILDRRCAGLQPEGVLFAGVSADHLSKMAARVGSPAFMLHDLRKMLATVGTRLAVGDAVLRRVLNHTPPKSDVLHRHYVELKIQDIHAPLERIQEHLGQLLHDTKPSATHPRLPLDV